MFAEQQAWLAEEKSLLQKQREALVEGRDETELSMKTLHLYHVFSSDAQKFLELNAFARILPTYFVFKEKSNLYWDFKVF